MYTKDEFLSELEHPELIPIIPLPYSKERIRQPPPNFNPPKYIMNNNVFQDYVSEVKNKGALLTAQLQILDLSNCKS